MYELGCRFIDWGEVFIYIYIWVIVLTKTSYVFVQLIGVGIFAVYAFRI